VLAVVPPLVPAVVPLVESALSSGPDIDLELVPTEDAAALLADDWIAVAPRGATWHRGRKVPVWTFDTLPAPLLGKR
jgi:hypothetical protein